MKRDSRIDILRSLAILLIVLAHTYSTRAISEFRCFDVPLMVFLMGSSYYLSEQKHHGTRSYGSYLWARIKRLLIPTWIFIVVYFLAFGLLHLLGFTFVQLDLHKFLLSVTLISGIGYVWIIRVFLIVALCSPLLLRLAQHIKNVWGLLLLEFAGLALQSVLLSAYKIAFNRLPSQSTGAQIVFEATGYLLIALVGMWAVHQSVKGLAIAGGADAAVFGILMLAQGVVSVGAQKFPPTAYFIAYGLAASLLLMAFLTVVKWGAGKAIGWLSRYSLELYYWHTFPVTVIMALIPNWSWLVRYPLTLAGGLVITWLQTKYLPRLFKPLG
ncbi:acyltransferase family protein [Lacticaseibacillus zhaodongensis]|uniref:acyltransferase family protein n=1 Tax=Lacticaseibacillus zhaodongensis TaxID=2668065 RepID=UPI0012D2CCED|nr:acyltransferase [Lacticaseibacillus zhaodongensis]